MKAFSEYEEKMISFLMGHGLSEEDAEQDVIDQRIDKLGDANRQLTKENERTYTSIISHDYDAYWKIIAFRKHIGEKLWQKLGGDAANKHLLVMAIDFNCEK